MRQNQTPCVRQLNVFFENKLPKSLSNPLGWPPNTCEEVDLAIEEPQPQGLDLIESTEESDSFIVVDLC